MSTEIEKLAGVHLGRSSDGTEVKPYVTPFKVDRELLVGVPRQLNRTDLGIENESLPFVGYDVWHAYETSFLLKSGYPVTGVTKIVYPADSLCIVESKSLKLYLNSFNLDIIEEKEYQRTVLADLYPILLPKPLPAPKVNFFRENRLYTSMHFPFSGGGFEQVESLTPDTTEFDSFSEDPSLLKPIENNQVYQRLTSCSLRSNCRVTNQPDWGNVFVAIRGEKGIDPTSFMKYVVSLRKENHFHEEICELIYKRLYDLLKPEDLFVACLYTRRGGIDINPIRASSYALIHAFAPKLVDATALTEKLLKQ